jgi:predicted RNase H-like HicB family nuclease
MANANQQEPTMTTLKHVYWQDEGMWLGYLEECPDYVTQGETLEDLQEHLRDIYQEVTSGSQQRTKVIRV